MEFLSELGAIKEELALTLGPAGIYIYNQLNILKEKISKMESKKSTSYEMIKNIEERFMKANKITDDKIHEVDKKIALMQQTLDLVVTNFKLKSVNGNGHQ